MSTFRVQGILSLDGQKFATGLQAAQSAAGRLAGRLAGLFTVGAMGLMAKRTLDFADNMADLAGRLGVAVEWLQEMRIAAKNSGGELEDMVSMVEKLNVLRFSAGEIGMNPKQAAALRQFGISEADFVKQSAEQTISAMSKAMQGTNAQQWLGALRTVGGTSAVKLANAFLEGIDDLRDQARRAGSVMSAEVIYKLKTINEQFAVLGQILTAHIGPILVMVAETALDLATNSGILGKALEGLDFIIRRITGERGLPSTTVDGVPYSAKQRSLAAAAALDMAQQYMASKRSFEDYMKARGAARDTTMAGMGVAVSTKRFPELGDDVSKSWKEELKYLNSLIQPVADATNRAAKGATRDFESLRQALAAWKNLVPPTPGPMAPMPLQGGTGTIKPLMDDQLVRVGNFLGTGSNIIEKTAREQVYLLTQIEKHTQKTANREECDLA